MLWERISINYETCIKAESLICAWIWQSINKFSLIRVSDSKILWMRFFFRLLFSTEKTCRYKQMLKNGADFISTVAMEYTTRVSNQTIHNNCNTFFSHGFMCVCVCLISGLWKIMNYLTTLNQHLLRMHSFWSNYQHDYRIQLRVYIMTAYLMLVITHTYASLLCMISSCKLIKMFWLCENIRISWNLWMCF